MNKNQTIPKLQKTGIYMFKVKSLKNNKFFNTYNFAY